MAFAEELHVVPSFHAKQSTVACNSKVSDMFLDSKDSCTHICLYEHG